MRGNIQLGITPHNEGGTNKQFYDPWPGNSDAAWAANCKDLDTPPSDCHSSLDHFDPDITVYHPETRGPIRSRPRPLPRLPYATLCVARKLLHQRIVGPWGRLTGLDL